jgi:ataxin-10
MGGSPTPELLQIHVSLGPFLAKRFFTLSVYAQNAMQKSLGTSRTPDSREPLAELDVMLPKVCEALVLVTQCITTIALEAEESKDRQFDAVGSITNMKEFFIDVRFSGQGLVENLIGKLLHLPKLRLLTLSQTLCGSSTCSSHGSILESLFPVLIPMLHL